MFFNTRYSTGMQYPNRTFFVFNATESTGAGHMMRCIRFANEFINRELEIYHIGLVEIEWLKESRFNELFSTSSEQLDFIPSINDIFIVDSYENGTIELYREIAKKNLVVQIIDSTTELIPNATYFSLDPYNPEIWSKNNILENVEWGLKYFPCKFVPYRFDSSQSRNILVTGGGSDINDFTKSFYKSVLNLDLDNLHFHIFSKSLNSSDENQNITIYPLGEDLIQILEKCSLVISSAGTSIWDFLANSRTLAVVKSVENQNMNYKYVGENSLAKCVGEWEEDKWNFEIQKISDFLTEPSKYSKLDVSNYGLDFMGAARFVDKVLEKFNLS